MPDPRLRRIPKNNKTRSRVLPPPNGESIPGVSEYSCSSAQLRSITWLSMANDTTILSDIYSTLSTTQAELYNHSKLHPAVNTKNYTIGINDIVTFLLVFGTLHCFRGPSSSTSTNMERFNSLKFEREKMKSIASQKSYITYGSIKRRK